MERLDGFLAELAVDQPLLGVEVALLRQELLQRDDRVLTEVAVNSAVVVAEPVEPFLDCHPRVFAVVTVDGSFVQPDLGHEDLDSFSARGTEHAVNN